MSLSSKLRNFRKDTRKNKKTKRGEELSDEQIASIARYMPRDMDALKPFLSTEQANAFGAQLLDITCAHTSRDQAKFEECILEMDAFVRGGVPGMELLDKVYPNIMKHFDVSNDDMDEVLEALKLYVNHKQNKIKRKWVKDEEEEQEQFASGNHKRTKSSQ